MHHWINRALRTALLLVFTLSLAACGQAASTNQASNNNANQPSAAPSEGEITVTDAQGTVTLPKTPSRIITMDFSFTDMLVTLGVQPVGIADDDSPELFMDSVKSQLTDYTSVGSRYEPNIELVSSLKPDLIIADINKHKNAITQMQAIAPVLVLDDFQADYDQMLKNYAIIAKAVGKEEEGKKRLQEHEAKMAEAKSKIKSNNLTVLPAVVNPKGFFGHSDHSYTGSVLAELGFADPVKHDESYPQLTLEQLVETNPQALFLMPTEEVTIVNQWETNPLWQKIDAVANNNVYKVERRNWALSRGMLGSEKIAEDIVNQLGEK
ncbi:ABC transporter substrate-binding protein [Paenibacillus spongiae]|uniref:ABC transporter substrate-binding protein n=1 Tax=Paenibacillus spongiae TaxID=2909671 RepID=A0ABY5S6E7_9BACL|nr:Fe(3+) dicitrate ABC transporter substrate-binding protein [Paenibacillus spongiae]UVI28422.1 ABC transporter substrate-binding protein [Paenibacillus spongiae]